MGAPLLDADTLAGDEPPSDQTVACTRFVRPPHTSASLTAWATDDLRAPSPAWVTLHEEHVKLPPAAFWHVVSIMTTERHWNRTIYSVAVRSLQHVDFHTGQPTVTPDAYTSPPPSGHCVYVLRDLLRKTPSPIGGSDCDCERSYRASEWSTQYIEEDGDEHVACFGLCVPESVVTSDNPRALTYWPFQYPKVRAYRFVYVKKDDEYTLRYDVIPLGDDSKYPRQFEELLKHARPAAVKMISHVRKRMAHYDPGSGRSTYVKRVVHDNIITEAAFRKWYDAMKVRHAPTIQRWAALEDVCLLKPFEELSIAAYLCALWEAERAEDAVLEKLRHEERHGASDDQKEEDTTTNTSMEEEVVVVVEKVLCDQMDKVSMDDDGNVECNAETESESVRIQCNKGTAKKKRERTKQKKQTFIDVGCGNGLLTYFLIEEGHYGIGIDLRKRPLWEHYPRRVQSSLLHEEIDAMTIDCTSYDWIVGNHPDELAPWIGAMAARANASNPLTSRPLIPHHRLPPNLMGRDVNLPTRRAAPRIFVLPCCFYDLDGRKVAFGHPRRTVALQPAAGVGKYEAYYSWIADLMKAFGFTVEKDNLRIPSTKYVALIGRYVQHELRIQPKVVRELVSYLTLDAKQSRH